MQVIAFMLDPPVGEWILGDNGGTLHTAHVTASTATTVSGDGLRPGYQPRRVTGDGSDGRLSRQRLGLIQQTHQRFRHWPQWEDKRGRRADTPGMLPNRVIEPENGASETQNSAVELTIFKQDARIRQSGRRKESEIYG